MEKQQVALLFHLMFFEDTVPLLSKFKPRVTKPKAVQLEKMKLIEVERTGKTQKALEKSPLKNISLTDYAWEWLAKNFVYPKGKPQAADYALERFFAKIRRMQNEDNLFFARLVELLTEKARCHTGECVAENAVSIDDAVVAAYLAASGGNFCEVVAISDIRKNMPQNMKDNFNDALLSMMRDKKLSLNVQGNPAMLKEEDKNNPVFVGGEPRHAVYIEGVLT